MSSKGHNFVAEGVVVGNSHSVAYAMLAARTLYLKTQFPIEFYVTFMASLKRSKKDYARIKLFVSDASKHGIEVLGADVNSSKLTYSIANDPTDPKKEIIRFGLAQVKNVGKAAEKIVENQPYESFEDYLNRGPNNKRVVMSLIFAGAFDTLHKNKGHLLSFFDDWQASRNKGVGVKRFKAFIKALGVSKEDAKRYEIDFKNVLQNEDWLEEEESEEISEDQVEEDLSNIQEYEDESIPLPDSDIAANEKTSDKSGDGASEKKKRHRSNMPKKEFRVWVKRRFSEYFDWRDVIRPALDDSVGDLIDPCIDDYKASDIIREIQCEGASQVYGCQLPFIHPLRWKKGKVHWIRDYGKDVVWHHKSDGETFRRQQNTIDGMVQSVQHRVSKNGNKYWRIVIDDGYDSVSVSIWKKVWEMSDVEGVLVYGDDGRPIKIGHKNGKPVWQIREIPKPKDLLKEGALVRLKVKNQSKWGFNLDHYYDTQFVEEQAEPVTELKMTVSWDIIAYRDAKNMDVTALKANEQDTTSKTRDEE